VAVASRVRIVGSAFISVLTLSDYDIGARGLVWTVVFFWCAVSPATAPPPATFRELGRNGIPAAVRAAGLLPNHIRSGPVVWIDGGQFGGQSVAFFRGARTAADALRQFCVTVAQTGGLCRAHALPQR
jgi:hypothetical protein